MNGKELTKYFGKYFYVVSKFVESVVISDTIKRKTFPFD